MDFLQQLRGEIDAKLNSSKFQLIVNFILFGLHFDAHVSLPLLFISLCDTLGSSCGTRSALQIRLFKSLIWSIESSVPTFLKSADAYQFDLTKAKIPSADWFGSGLWVITLEESVYLKEQILEEAQWHIACWNVASVIIQGSDVLRQLGKKVNSKWGHVLINESDFWHIDAELLCTGHCL